MIVKWYLSEQHACGYVRGETIAREINKQCTNIAIDCKMDIMLSDFYKANIMLFQRAHDPIVFEKMMSAKQHGIKTIYEIDDDLFNVPKEFQKPYKFYDQPEVRATMAKFLAEAHVVTVSTHKLALALKRYNPSTPTFVVDNYLDAELWEPVYASKQVSLSPDVTIGWMASGSHMIDAPLVMDALDKLMTEFPNLRIHFIGWMGFGEFPNLQKYSDRIKVDNWTMVDRLPFVMEDFTIGIAPLITGPFNDCKSNIKWQQYSALGIPSVVSPVPAYDNVKHGYTGLVAEGNNPDAWYNHLKTLITDKGLRNELGQKARKEMLDHWDMRGNIASWITVFNQTLK